MELKDKISLVAAGECDYPEEMFNQYDLVSLCQQFRTTEQDRDQYKFWYENETMKFVAAADEITVLSREIESLRAQLKAAQEGKTADGNPTELEMHRADYNAIKAAGFESPGELLAAYKVLEDKIKAAQEDK